MINFSNFHQATLARLGPLRLTTSHTFLYKKLDEFGKDYKKHITDAVQNQGEVMAKKHQHHQQQADDSVSLYFPSLRLHKVPFV